MTVVSALTIRIGLPSGETYTPEDGLVGFWLDDEACTSGCWTRTMAPTPWWTTRRTSSSA